MKKVALLGLSGLIFVSAALTPSLTARRVRITHLGFGLGTETSGPE
jgi:hypothetical protein